MPAHELETLLELPADSKPVKLVTEKWGSFGKSVTGLWNKHKGKIMGAAKGLWNAHKGKIMGAAAGLAKKWMGGGGGGGAAAQSSGYGYGGGWENEDVQEDEKW